MIVLAFDPGAHVGTALLETQGGGRRPRYCAGGEIGPSVEEVRWMLTQSVRAGADRVVIESEPPGQAKKAHVTRKGGRKVDISGPLQDMAQVAGLIYGMATSMGFDVVWMPATKWRRIVCGKATATDAEVKHMVTMLVEGLPAKTNTHVRDAVGCALGATLTGMR